MFFIYSTHDPTMSSKTYMTESLVTVRFSFQWTSVDTLNNNRCPEIRISDKGCISQQLAIISEDCPLIDMLKPYRLRIHPFLPNLLLLLSPFILSLSTGLLNPPPSASRLLAAALSSMHHQV